jgi:plasmid maintenance system killer protein
MYPTTITALEGGWRRCSSATRILPPSNHLEKLVGNRKGQHSIRINDRWRICFAWKVGDAYQVEIAEYH